MASDSITEVAGVQQPVAKDASEKALKDSNQSAKQVTAQEIQALNEKNMQAMRQAGLLPELAIEGAKEIAYVQKNFDKIDRSADGWVTAAEIDAYAKENAAKLSNSELEALRKVKEKISTFEDHSNDELGYENDGITKADLSGIQKKFGIYDYAQKNFDKLDHDGDGHVTVGEIDAFIKFKGKVGEQEQTILNNLRKSVGDIEEISNDEWGDENDGFSRYDLQNGKEKEGTERLSGAETECKDVKASGDLRQALDYARDNFEKIDADKDGYLDADEISGYADANKGTLSNEDKAKLVALKNSVGGVEEQSNDERFDEDNGITKADISEARPRLDALAYAKTNFDKLDGNADGFITEGDIDAYSNARHNLSADEKLNLKYLQENISNLEEYANDELADEDDGITRSDVTDALIELGSLDARSDCQTADAVKPADAAKPADAKAQSKNEERLADSGLDYLRKRFSFVDRDGDNFVTKSEIDKYIKDNEKSLTSGENLALKRLASKVDDLEEMYNDELADENDGITRQDINVAEEQMKATEYAKQNFSKLDLDGDGYVTSGEVNSYVRANSDRLSAQDRSNLDYLKRNADDLEEYSNDELGDENDGFTSADLRDALDETGSNTVGTEGNTEKLPLPAPVQYKYDSTTEAVKLEAVAAESERLFDQLDEDSDGYLSESELADAVQCQKYTGKDAQIVATLYKNQDDLEELSNDELADENDGITRADLKQFDKDRDKIQSDWQQIGRARVFLNKDDNFKKVDTDSDDYLTKSEIRKALERTDLTQDERTSLEFLRDNVDDIEEASNDELGDENDGITKDDLKSYGDSTVVSVYNAVNRTNEAQKTGSRDLYANKENPLESIKPDAIKQGMIGNCYFEAAVASLAAVDPEAIHRMIKDNGDGTYTVTFPGNTDEPITVKAPTESEMGIFNQGSADGTWASVLEKAYGAYCNRHWYRRGPTNLFGGDTDAEGGDGGAIRSGNAMELLTGRDNDTDWFTFSSESEIADKLNEALNGSKRRPVIAGIRNHIFSSKTDDGFPVAHAYSVIGFDPKGPDGGTVTIRNPWGDGQDTTRGTIKVSLKVFEKNFSNATYTE
jgi:Ca2+-binding EF-hand superfamily protein